MMPTIGRIVIAAMDPSLNNGADVAPAIITSVFFHAYADTTQYVVNLRVMRDSEPGSADWLCSVKLLDERPEELFFSGENFVEGRVGRPLRRGGYVRHVCWWPPRV